MSGLETTFSGVKKSFIFSLLAVVGVALGVNVMIVVIAHYGTFKINSVVT